MGMLSIFTDEDLEYTSFTSTCSSIFSKLLIDNSLITKKFTKSLLREVTTFYEDKIGLNSIIDSSLKLLEIFCDKLFTEFASSTNEDRVEDGIHIQVVKGIEATKLVDLDILMKKINTVIFVVSKIDIDSYGDISLYDTRGISKVMIAPDADIARIWSDLVSAVDTEPLKSKLQKNKDALEYLDIRFGDKVFYKFTGDTATTSKFTNNDKPVIIDTHEATTTIISSTTIR